MSHAADPASGSVTLEVAELALLAHLGGRLPLVLPALPPQPDETWDQVLDHVVSRGLLIRDGDQVTVLETAEPLLLPIIGGDFALEATIGTENNTWLAAEQSVPDELVIECGASESEGILITPVDYDAFEDRVAAFLRLDGEVRGVDGAPIVVPADQLQAAAAAAGAGEPVELPAAPEFGAALAAGELRRIEVRWVDEGEVVGSRYEWADAGADGVWVTSTAEDGTITVQQRATISFWEHLVTLLP